MLYKGFALMYFKTSLLESLFDTQSHVVSKIHRDCVTDHFIPIIDLIIDEEKVIWEGLYSSHLSDSHTTI